MVTDVQTHNILRRLERYFIKLTDYTLSGETYDLILLIPSDIADSVKNTWVISCKYTDPLPQKNVLHDLLSDFREALTAEEFLSVSRISILNSNTPLVKNIQYMFPYRQETIELSNYSIGGVQIDKAFILKSSLLERLKAGNAVTIIDKKGKKLSAGIISINREYDIKYYTGKALNKLFTSDLSEKQKSEAEEIINKPDEFLKDNAYIDTINLDDILELY